MLNHRTGTILSITLALSLTTAAHAQSGGGYDLSWNSIAGGGETFSTGGGYEVGGTVGQADAGETTMTGGGYALTGGFWAAAQPATTAGVPTLSEWGVIGLVLVMTVTGVIVIRRRRTAPA